MAEKINTSGPAFGLTNEYKRNEWLKKNLLTVPAGSRILDAGAGELKYKDFCTHLTYVSQDFGEYKGAGDGTGLQKKSWDTTGIDILSDITSIPVPDGSFDAVMCVEVLEHVPDPLSALRELDRVLKNGGHLLITVPFNSITHFSPYHYSTGFSRNYFEKHLADLGYSPVEVEVNGSYFEYLAQELYRLPRISLKYAGIRPGRLVRMAARIVLRFLEKLEMRDQGSKELLCFGIMVHAIKGRI